MGFLGIFNLVEEERRFGVPDGSARGLPTLVDGITLRIYWFLSEDLI